MGCRRSRRKHSSIFRSERAGWERESGCHQEAETGRVPTLSVLLADTTRVSLSDNVRAVLRTFVKLWPATRAGETGACDLSV
jgi:hypothetical protein